MAAAVVVMTILTVTVLQEVMTGLLVVQQVTMELIRGGVTRTERMMEIMQRVVKSPKRTYIRGSLKRFIELKKNWKVWKKD